CIKLHSGGQFSKRNQPAHHVRCLHLIIDSHKTATRPVRAPRPTGKAFRLCITLAGCGSLCLCERAYKPPLNGKIPAVGRNSVSEYLSRGDGTMTKTIVGLYDRFEDAQAAVRELTEAGFERENISMVASDAEGKYTRDMHL